MALTDVAIRNTKAKDKPYKLGLGTYPEVSLADARRRRDDAREMVAAGKDPSREKQRDKVRAKLDADNTFAALSAEYCKKRRRDGAKAWAPATAVRSEYLLSLLSPALGAIPIADIEPADILGVDRRAKRTPLAG